MPLRRDRLSLSRDARSCFLERSRLSMQLLQGASRTDHFRSERPYGIRRRASLPDEQIPLCAAKRGFPALQAVRRLRRGCDPDSARSLWHSQRKCPPLDSGRHRRASRHGIRSRVAAGTHCAPRTALVAGHWGRHLTVRSGEFAATRTRHYYAKCWLKTATSSAAFFQVLRHARKRTRPVLIS